MGALNPGKEGRFILKGLACLAWQKVKAGIRSIRLRGRWHEGSVCLPLLELLSLQEEESGDGSGARMDKICGWAILGQRWWLVQGLAAHPATPHVRCVGQSQGRRCPCQERAVDPDRGQA